MQRPELLGVTFECSKAYFYTQNQHLLSKNRLSVEILEVSTPDSIDHARFKQFSGSVDSSTLSDFINIKLEDEKLLHCLRDEILNGFKVFGFYVRLNAGNDGYGLLTPTVNDLIWCIRLIDEGANMHKIRRLERRKEPQEARSNNKYIELRQLKQKILDVNYTEPSNLIISNVSLNDIISNHKTGLDDMQVDIKRMDDKNRRDDKNTAVVDGIIDTKSKIEVDKVLKIRDPLKFLADRYCKSLYSDSNILEHFLKSSIPKMHLLRRDDVQLAKKCLRSLMVDSTNAFDIRHRIEPRYDENMKLQEFKETWLSNEILLDGLEYDYRLKALTSLNLLENIKLCNSDALNDFLDNLKITDLKLQILLDLEYLKLLKKEDKSAKHDHKGIDKLQKSSEPKKRHSTVLRPRLVGKKKRLIPTLLGTVIPNILDFDTDLRENMGQEETDGQSMRELPIEEVERLILLLFDKLSVWDAILGLDYKDLNSSWGFLSNCAIPYYEKYHSKLLHEMAIKSRGSSFILREKTRKEKQERRKRKEEKIQKKEQEQKALKRKPTNIDLSQLKLKRAHSSFSSTTELSKKTFDMFKSASSFSMTYNSNSNSIIERIDSTANLISRRDSQSSDTSNGGFMNIKKRKLLAPVIPHSSSGHGTENLNDISISALYPKHQSKDSIRPCHLPKLKYESKDLLLPNQIIEETPRKERTVNKVPNLSIVEASPVLQRTAPKSTKPLQFEPISPEKKDWGHTQILETPKLERVQVKPGFFEIGSSPMKSGSRNYSPKKMLVHSPHHGKPVLSRNDAKSTKRKLKFN